MLFRSVLDGQCHLRTHCCPFARQGQGHQGSDHKFCSFVVNRTGCLVFDIDYRKAPEDPFPAALQDVENAVVYVAVLLPISTNSIKTNIFLSRFSTGRNLALSNSALQGPAAPRASLLSMRRYISPKRIRSPPEKDFLECFNARCRIYFMTHSYSPVHGRRPSAIGAPCTTGEVSEAYLRDVQGWGRLVHA